MTVSAKVLEFHVVCCQIFTISLILRLLEFS